MTWVLDRFDLAGMPAPAVSTISFDPFDTRCQEVRGYADWAAGTTDVLACFDSVTVTEQSSPDEEVTVDSGLGASSGQAQLLLHEVSHAWLVEHVDEATAQTFLRLTGLQSWNDLGDAWSRRGVEYAAETLVWGLLGRRNTRLSLGSPPCTTLAAGFRLLTSAEPLTPCGESP